MNQRAEQSLGVALLGCGTVGQGVARLLIANRDRYAELVGVPVELKAIAVRDLDRDRDVPRDLLTVDAAAAIDRPDVQIVVETIGGIGPALDWILRALSQGKSVVTANKEVLAKHGDAIFETAAKHVAAIKVLQCMLQQRGMYAGKVNGRYNKRTIAGMHKWKTTNGFGANDQNRFRRPGWVAFLSEGSRPTLKIGSAGEDVRRVQRSLNAVFPKRHLPVTGVYDTATAAVVATYQKAQRIKANGIVNPPMWKLIQRGVR